MNDDADFLDRHARFSIMLRHRRLRRRGWPGELSCHATSSVSPSIFDTQSGFIARGMTTPTPLSRGEFGARASRRILDLLASRGIKTTWFIPGFTIESWPRECSDVVAGGHEVAHHSWAHIPPAAQTRKEEEADLVRANDAI